MQRSDGGTCAPFRTAMRGKRGMGERGRRLTIPLVAGLLLLAAPLRADQQAAPSNGDTESDTDLAKKTQNPVADLISVPFQNNFNFNTGPRTAPSRCSMFSPSFRST
jgi:hypothetical protein